MTKHLFLSGLLFLLSLVSFPQDDPPQSDADNKADSILNEFFKNKDNSHVPEYGIDSAKLEQAESKHMNNFLQMQRDKEKELLHKRILQVTVGLALLSVLFIGFRKRRVVNRDSHSPRN